MGARISRLFLFLYVSVLGRSGYLGQRISLRLSSSPFIIIRQRGLFYSIRIYCICLRATRSRTVSTRPVDGKEFLVDLLFWRCPIRLGGMRCLQLLSSYPMASIIVTALRCHLMMQGLPSPHVAKPARGVGDRNRCSRNWHATPTLLVLIFLTCSLLLCSRYMGYEETPTLLLQRPSHI